MIHAALFILKNFGKDNDLSDSADSTFAAVETFPETFPKTVLPLFSCEIGRQKLTIQKSIVKFHHTFF